MNEGPRDRERARSRRVGEALNRRVKALAKQNRTSVASLSRELTGNRSSLRNSLLSPDGPDMTTVLWLCSRLGLRSVEELFGDFGSSEYITAMTARIDDERPEKV